MDILTWISVVLAVLSASVLTQPIVSLVMDKLEDRFIPPNRRLPVICCAITRDDTSPEETPHV